MNVRLYTVRATYEQADQVCERTFVTLGASHNDANQHVKDYLFGLLFNISITKLSATPCDNTDVILVRNPDGLL